MTFDRNFLRVFFKVLIILLGSFIFTSLISVRSWYKPLIQNKQVSPADVVLKKDVSVVDKIATDKAREEAKLSSVFNLSDKEVLSVDDSATQKSFEELKRFTKVIQSEISEQKTYEVPIINKIDTDHQLTIVRLSDDSFNQLKAMLEAKAGIEDADPKLENIYSELASLSTFEKNFFLSEVERYRKDYKEEKKIDKLLGESFFSDFKKIENKKLFISKLFSIQRKLLKIGIVNGLPKSKIAKNIEYLFPELEPQELNLSKKIILNTANPNIGIDWRKVEEVENQAVASVKDVKVNLPEGTVLAKKGKRVTERDYYYMKDLGLLRPSTDWKQITKYTYVVYCTLLLFTLYVVFIEKKRYSILRLLMIFTVVLGSQALVALVSLWGINKIPLIPLALMPMLLTLFYLPSIAFFTTFLVSFFLIYSFDLNLWQVLPMSCGAIYSIFLVQRAHQREDLANAGTKIAICQSLVFLFTVLIAVRNFNVSSVLVITSFYALGGVLSGFISLAVLPYLEATFRLLTPFKLSELSNPNQALLKKLKEEAPGTYQHSLNVSSLAEEASNAVGANTELIRVGLLYHDIGKTYNPDYFIENNLGKPNPHTTLDDPQKSAEIIIAHVPEGAKLAKKHKLPQAIIDFIPMHQGTTVTNYFYYKAIERFGKSNVDPEDFRYPGPIPNTKETGIAMIADSAEAALKSEKDLDNEVAVREKIEKIVTARLKEGELSNSGLSFAELELIKDSFVKVWRSQNHQRIKYPEEPKENVE
ncbi:MAG: HDIG domain-containing protein [Candidatus Caenarcaniphilales bacterium]|nr:HDIG domain-containing protein [Candidatus Caenarcaniphilales bacterium]